MIIDVNVIKKLLSNERNNNFAHLNRMLGEIVKRGTDRNALEEMMH